MSSAFSNPILYGWFNEAFQDEFTSIGRYVKSTPFLYNPYYFTVIPFEKVIVLFYQLIANKKGQDIKFDQAVCCHLFAF